MNMSGLHCGKSKVLYPQAAWDRGDLDTLQRFFSYTISNTKGKPTHSGFIALIADKLQLQLKSDQVANFCLRRNGFPFFFLTCQTSEYYERQYERLFTLYCLVL